MRTVIDATFANPTGIVNYRLRGVGPWAALIAVGHTAAWTLIIVFCHL
jgi:hypothetical protein